MHDKVYTPLRLRQTSAEFPLVQRIWEVRADMSYDVRWGGKYPHKGLVFLRTFSGRGLVSLRDAGRINPSAHSMLLLHPADILGYRTVKPTWSFLWFELSCATLLDIPCGKLMSLPVSDGEIPLLSAALKSLGGDEFSDSLASLRLSLQIMEWVEYLKGVERKMDGAGSRVAKIARIMAKTTDSPLKVADLAARAFISESRFRQLFVSEFGIPPKRYYKHLRMSRALHWLRSTDMKLSEIAERLSFSSQYHLSREFTRQFGRPPTQFRPRNVR